ncbi:hypothetical protein EMCRGX_G011752 [Ephydatia muelleri]|eukprot:Em0006g674a
MTQIVFLLYEDTQQPPDSPLRYTVSIRFSPGTRYRERFLSDRSPSDDKLGSYCDCRVSIQDNGHKSQTGCTSSCNHSVVLNQRLSRLTSQAGMEKRASPFRKLSHTTNLTDLQKDYEEMQVSLIWRNERSRKLRFVNFWISFRGQFCDEAESRQRARWARGRGRLVSFPDPDSQQLRVDYITATWKVAH